jgi:acyl-CoA thioesterase
MTDPSHPFDAAVHLDPLGPGRWRGRTHPAYANMVGPFGGITAAAALRAVLLDPARQGEPVALTVNYAGPLAEGDFVVAAEAVRTNRSTQHWSVRIEQAGDVAATASAVLATRRETWSAVEAGFPAAPPAATLERAATLGRARWTEAYDIRFVKGALQFVAPPPSDPDSVSLLWVRDEPPRALDFEALTALADTFFPRVFVRRPSWVPIGTVSFTVYFHADGGTLRANGAEPLLAHARAHQFRNGYFDQAGELWGAGGELLAVTHQIVYFKE